MSFSKALLSWLAFPVYVWQGVGVRLRTARLLPPEGPVTGKLPGKGEPLRLLVLGDSSAATVGAERTEEGLAGQLAARIGKATGRPVVWRAAGFNSATSGQLRDFVVPNLAHNEWDLIVLSVGTNDAKNFHTVPRFKREFGGLLYALNAKFPHADIVWSPVLDMQLVPALPAQLGRLLEIRAGLINRMGVRLCQERGALPASRLPVLDSSGFSSDGFHASAIGYGAWADHIWNLMAELPSIQGGSEPSASSLQARPERSSRNLRAS
ncbi:MAG: SGNH/GDSL hydrolase family protein [Rhizobiaceae bacterium]|nr:SGNH/GDSL hydrolase family protein [Rhizobiaceae bacterium]